MISKPLDTVPARSRWLIPAALLVTTLVNWLDRSAMSFALPRLAAEHGWTTAEIGRNGGTLIAMFFVGYGLSNLFLSPLAERFGPRRSIIVAIVAFSTFTALNAPLGSALVALVTLRVLLGLAEGIHFPMSSAIVSRWFQLGERSRANGMWVFGPQLAVIAGPFLMVPVITHFGWRAMFVLLGGVGLLVALPVVVRFVRDDGPLAPPPPSPGSQPVSALAVFRQLDYCLALAGGILNNIVLYGLLTWLPTYLAQGRKVPFADLAASTSAPYWLGALAIPFWATIGDFTNKRALLASLGSAGGAIGIALAARAPTLGATVLFLSISVFFQNAYNTSEFTLVQRVLPPERVGAATGFYNGIAVIVGGAGGTWLVGKVVETTGSYDAGLTVVVLAGVANAVVVAILARRIRY